MVGNRWQSSSRSLSVRTIWVDGHRHVVLFDKDPYVKSHQRQITQSLYSENISISKSPSPLPESPPQTILQISTARLFHNRSKTVQTKRELTIYSPELNSTSEVLIESHPLKQMKLQNLEWTTCGLKLSKSFDYEVDHVQNSNVPINSLKQSFLENDSLSERVLHWLDLAAINETNPSPDLAKEERRSKSKSAVVHDPTLIHNNKHSTTSKIPKRNAKSAATTTDKIGHKTNIEQNLETSKNTILHHKNKPLTKHVWTDENIEESRPSSSKDSASRSCDDFNTEKHVISEATVDTSNKYKHQNPSSNIDHNDQNRSNGTQKIKKTYSSKKEIHIFIPTFDTIGTDTESNMSSTFNVNSHIFVNS